MTLEFARSLPVEVGANLRGEQVDSCWVFLLPALHLEQVVIVGEAPPGTAAALAAIAADVSTPGPRAPLADAQLVYVGRGVVPSLARDGARVTRLRATLDGGGAVYFEAGARRRDLRAVIGGLAVGGEVILAAGAATVSASSSGRAGWRVPSTRLVAGTRHRGEVALRLARAALARALGSSVSRGGQRVSEAQAALGVRSVRNVEPCPASGEGLLLHGGEPGALPAYVRDVAAAGGVALEDDGWRIAPPRGYRSQKVIFFVRAADGSAAVVKLTQDRRFNELLDNEARALEALVRIAPGKGPRVPRLLFTGAHAGLSVVGEEALAGRPFVQVARAGGESPDAAAVAASITDLGAATRRPAGSVTEALTQIGDAYVELFRPSPRVASRLREAQRTLAALGSDLPVVFMHGDATVLNVLVDGDREIGFVDWENADAAGMPLWDLMHMLVTHHVWSEERAGRRARPADVAAALCAGRRLDPLRTTAVAHYVDEVGVPADAVAPLRLTWAARHALRDARQLRSNALQTSFHHRLLTTLAAVP